MVESRSTAPARLPSGLPGLDAAWSRLVTAPTATGQATWHLLDNAVADPAMTLLCVHGNPTWSYLWRNLIRTAPEGVRVVAVDQLDMGFSERTGRVRRLADRIDDLSELTGQLGLTGPVVTVGHDWGGPISVGWALRHRDQLAGIVLANTGVHQPVSTAGATSLRFIRGRMLRDLVCVRTAAFIRGTLLLSNPRPKDAIRAAYLAPYGEADQRRAIGDFVEDIPFRPDDPSSAALAGIAAGLETLADVPALLLWGSRDPVFSDAFLRDLQVRLPGAATHRFAGAGHLTPEDADVAAVVYPWLGSRTAEAPDAAADRPRLWEALRSRRDDETDAIVEIGGERGRAISFAGLERAIQSTADGLTGHGVRRGTRVSLLIPPGIALSVALHAAWRIGAVAVFVDAGLGPSGIRNALRSARPDVVVGDERALVAARILGLPGSRILTHPVSASIRRALGATTDLDALARNGSSHGGVEPPDADDMAAIAFTSGATGPAKGVAYRHRQLEAQRDALVRLYGIEPSDRLVAAFAPFALFGPIMGITSAVPDMDITAPATLTAPALADAVAEIDATLVFASPSALRNVAATARELSDDQRTALEGLRLCLAAGAPMPRSLLRSAKAVMPNAGIHTPYGMTEVLPVADVSLAELESIDQAPGVCVGYPVPEVEVRIAPLDETGAPADELIDTPGVVGEVCIRAAHMRHGYDQLWATDHAASQPPGWHRSGDVGRFDQDGRLWIEGRLAHVVTTSGWPVAPIALEHTIEAVEDVARAAVVGVGPAGAQVLVAVVESDEAPRQGGLADLELAQRVRAAVPLDVAAVLAVRTIPVDIRHNSKINRIALATWAEDVCAGKRAGAP